MFVLNCSRALSIHQALNSWNGEQLNGSESFIIINEIARIVSFYCQRTAVHHIRPNRRKQSHVACLKQSLNEEDRPGPVGTEKMYPAMRDIRFGQNASFVVVHQV